RPSGPDQLPSELPTWATAPLDDAQVDLLNTWGGSSRSWEDEEAFLRAHEASLRSPELIAAIELLEQLFCENPLPARAHALLDELDADGFDAVLTRRRRAYDLSRAIGGWIATPTWAHSRNYLEGHIDILKSSQVVTMLAEQASSSPAAAQHLGILLLLEHMPMEEVYDVVTDETVAVDEAAAALEAGRGDELQAVMLASPGLRRLPFFGPLFLAGLSLFAGDLEGTANLAHEAATQGNNTQCRAAASRLGALGRTRPDLQQPAARLAALLVADATARP
ncbi:MAG: hypothetical protein ACRDJG_13470, partial [Actinomycetota bacterium]